MAWQFLHLLPALALCAIWIAFILVAGIFRLLVARLTETSARLTRRTRIGRR